MMDYSELVKSLREATGWKNASKHYSLMGKAADAIEELQAAVEREKTYTQFWQDAAETCKVQYEKMEKKMLDWQAVADEHWEAYQHWFYNYMNDVPKWIPVTERLPEEYVNVLCYCSRNKQYGCGEWSKEDNGTIYWSGLNGMIPTHWMPLPEPPKEETE